MTHCPFFYFYRERDGLPLDSLFGVLLLLELENVLVEVELQVLVGVVDAQLLKTVFLYQTSVNLSFIFVTRAERKLKTYGEVLETEDVEDVDRCGSFALVDDRIDAIHQPSEKRTANEKTKLSTLFIYRFINSYKLSVFSLGPPWNTQNSLQSF